MENQQINIRCKSDNYLILYDQGLKISLDTRWSWDNYQNNNRSLIHGHLIVMIRRSAETADDHMMIVTILTDNQHVIK